MRANGGIAALATEILPGNGPAILKRTSDVFHAVLAAKFRDPRIVVLQGSRSRVGYDVT
jgi:hypothetical protein